MAKNRYYRSQSLNAQWDDLSQSISTLLIDNERSNSTKPEATLVVAERPQIATKHWIDSGSRAQCIASECGKRFTLTDRKHHCRRCGEVFCGHCTQYRRRLSVFATPDCEGILYRVCKKCFDVGPQTVGVVRSLSNDFKIHKQKHKERSANNNGKHRISAKDFKLNFQDECERLVEGFKKKVASSRIKNFVVETLGVVKVPVWQKSKHWVEKSEQCLLCYKTFSLTELKSRCRVCGKVICSSCSSDMLIVYVDEDNSVKWCLINIIGSPDEEPAKCMYLKVCNYCHGELAEIQGHSAILAQKMETDGLSLVDEIQNINQLLTGVQDKILVTLPKYEKLVDAVEAKGDLKGVVEQGQSATQLVAKYHLDLSDLFTKFAVVMQSLKKLKPQTNMQVKLAKNMTSSKLYFYNDYFPIYRENKRRLEEVLPVNVLEGVQKIVDEQAINSAYIVIKQLAFEALLLISKHKIDNQVIPEVLATCAQICLDDLKTQLSHSNTNCDQHLETVNELLKIQLKEHRLVKPSSCCTSKHGTKYVQWFLLDRSHLLFSQTIRQLNGKTADKKFKLSKNALQEAQMKIGQLRDQS